MARMADRPVPMALRPDMGPITRGRRRCRYAGAHIPRCRPMPARAIAGRAVGAGASTAGRGVVALVDQLSAGACHALVRRAICRPARAVSVVIHLAVMRRRPST